MFCLLINEQQNCFVESIEPYMNLIVVTTEHLKALKFIERTLNNMVMYTKVCAHQWSTEL